MGTLFKYLRRLRILVALCIFALISVQFLDIYHQLPKSYYMLNPTSTQFAPSLLKMLAGGGIIAGAAFITFCICALLFGRAYCSFVCPFGILMDILRRIALFPASSKFLKNAFVGKFCAKNFALLRYKPSRTALRAFFTIIAAVFIIFGYSALFGFIDPYSLYGKIMGSITHPAVAMIADAASKTAYAHGLYSIPPVDGDPTIPLAAFAFALFVLLAISALSAFRGRFYCNTICPVGGLLGLLSSVSLFKISLDKNKCISCGMCERNCKAECINSKAKTLDFSKCVLCFDCSLKCPRNAIKYSLNPKAAKLFGMASKPESSAIASPEKKTSNGNMTRRAFPVAAAALAALLCTAAKKYGMGKGKNRRGDAACAKVEAIDAKCGEPTPYGIPGVREDKRLTLPPGAESLDNYLEHCTGCQICTAACKAQILKPSLGEWGLAGLMQPYMDFESGFCLHSCNDCSKACPTGAIKFVGGKVKRTIKIGTAVFRKSLCVVKTDGTDCAACAEHCPVQAIEMVPFGKLENSLYIPHVHEEVCIGCGACENICPVLPHRAIVVRGLAKQTKAKEFNESMRIYKRKERAPKPMAPSTSADAFPF